MEQIAKAGRCERLERGKRLKDIGKDRLRRVPLDSLGGHAEAVSIEIEKRDGGFGNRPFGPVEEIAGANPDIKVTGRHVAVVESAQLGRTVGE
jgi:hypothetical protein